MDNLENSTKPESVIISSPEIKEYLLETSKWGKLLAIIGYIGMGLLVLIALFMMIGLSTVSHFTGNSFPMGLLGIIYIGLAAIYYFPVTYLYRFSIQIKEGLNASDSNTVTSGFQNLKSLFKFMGIFTIVILSIYALVLVIALPVALFFSR